MSGYQIGMSALRASHTRIVTHGNNIANAATPGYARQVVDLVELPQREYQNLLIGTGVKVSQIRSMRDEAAEAGLSRTASLHSSLEAQLDASKSIEALLTPSEFSIHTYISDVFNNLERVANAPEESTARTELIRSAESLVNEAALISSNLDEVQIEARRDHSLGVDTVNNLIKDIAALNREIWTSQTAGSEPHGLLAQRDGAVGELSKLIDVRIENLDNGASLVMLGGGSASFSIEPIELASEVVDEELMITVRPGREVTASGGKLHGLQTVVNSLVGETKGEIDGLVREIVRQIDQLHATGLSNTGGFQSLTSTRGATFKNVPLVDAGLAFPVTDGELFVTVTDQATGSRATSQINFDPETNTLEDFASRLASIDNLNALVIDNSNQLVIRASNGFSFDFAGRPDNIASTSAFAGTSEVTFSGVYTPSATVEAAFEPSAQLADVNQRLSISLPNAGEVGVTPGLTAEVRDESGTLIQTIAVGPEYTIGEPISLDNGLFVTFGEGTVVSGDQVSVNAIGDSDTTGMLSALGVNSLFTGSSVEGFQVRADILENPFLFSASATGEIGDARNVAKMASLRDHRFESLGSRSFVETIADLTATAGLDVQQGESDVGRVEAYQTQLAESRDSVAGVNTNEELLDLLAAERAFQAAARFVTAFDETVLELIGLAR